MSNSERTLDDLSYLVGPHLDSWSIPFTNLPKLNKSDEFNLIGWQNSKEVPFLPSWVTQEPDLVVGVGRKDDLYVYLSLPQKSRWTIHVSTCNPPNLCFLRGTANFLGIELPLSGDEKLSFQDVAHRSNLIWNIYFFGFTRQDRDTTDPSNEGKNLAQSTWKLLMIGGTPRRVHTSTWFRRQVL